MTQAKLLYINGDRRRKSDPGTLVGTLGATLDQILDR